MGVSFCHLSLYSHSETVFCSHDDGMAGRPGATYITRRPDEGLFLLLLNQKIGATYKMAHIEKWVYVTKVYMSLNEM